LSRRYESGRGHSLLKVLVFVLAVLLLPFSVSFLIHIPGLFREYSSISGEMLWSAGGFIFFLLVFFIFGAPVKSYILEHEISHIIFALMSGVRIKKVSLKRSNAYVKTERVNMLIALAPYSLPLYTLLLLLVYRVAARLAAARLIEARFVENPFVTAAMYFLFGATLSFHMVATMHYVQLDQPDMRRYGYFSSLILVFTWSLVVLAVIFSLMFDRIDLIHYFRTSMEDALDVYGTLLAIVRRAVHSLVKLLDK